MQNTRIILAITFVFGLISLALLVFLLYQGINRPQNAAPSRADSGNNSTGSDDVTKCQGNSNPSAKCFKCEPKNKNSPVNILDFACFQKFYGQNVGKP